MATHLGLTALPKGFGSSFAGKEEADVPEVRQQPFADGIGTIRIEHRHTFRAIMSLLVALGLR